MHHCSYSLWVSSKLIILVLYWDGGTLDVSILSLERGEIQVKDVGGDLHLEGLDVDNIIL